MRHADVRWAHVRDTRTIDFELRDGTVRRNVMASPCSNLLTVGAFEPVATHAEYCPGDEILVPSVSHEAGEPDGTICRLDSFTP